jgi:chromosome partitioning protein
VTRTLAVANSKGGVGKTTTVVSLGAAFVEQGLRVLLVDLDSQACLTFCLGIDPEDGGTGAFDLLIGTRPVADVVVRVWDGLDLIPSSVDLSAAEPVLLPRSEREFVLRTALDGVRDAYDVVLLDCSPSLGILTLNALAAADEVIVPMQCEMLGHRGVGQLLDTVDDVRRLLNPCLTVRGILPTMVDVRVVHTRAVLQDVTDRYDVPVLDPPIPRSIRFAEAPAAGRPVLVTASGSTGAMAYRAVARSLTAAWRLRLPCHGPVPGSAGGVSVG